MNQAIRTLAFILSLVCLLSFHKHPDPTPKPNGTKLYKVYMWHSSHPDRDIDIYEYYYDSLKRVTEIKQYLLDSIDGSLQYKYIKTMQCFYNGSEQLPYKTKGFHHYAEKEIWYFYDSGGRVITDSMSATIGNDYRSVNKYKWYNDKFIRKIRSPFTGEEDFSVINSHNVISNVLTIHGAAHIAYTQAVFTFDNKINPLNVLNIGPMLMTLSWPYATYDQTVCGFNKNNFTEILLGKANSNNEFIPKFKYTYVYKYNKADFPVECEISGLFSSRAKDRIQYYYID